MRDEQWDVFWSQVYWLAAITLAAQLWWRGSGQTRALRMGAVGCAR